jgi:quercetin dioxygenase-like cupin family protein
MEPLKIADTFVALDDAGRARPLPVTPQFWENLTSGRLGQFSRMISQFAFDSDWDTWEKHPAGEEFVCLLEGDVDFILEQPGGEKVITLNQPGSFVLVPKNTWHTAKVRRPSKMLFVTPGEGTENKPI